LLRAGGYHRRAVLVGTGAHIEAVAHALRGSSVHPVGFVSLTPRPENGLRNLGPLDELDRHFDSIDEVLIADPDFPQEHAVELIVLAPVLALIALAIKLTSRGPVIYRSLRPGIGGEPFACFKFRTMYEGAERRQHELEAANEASGAIFKIRRDPRVTPVGRALRRWSLDELPQLFNVLRGEMSLVGPRPLPQRDYERLESWHRKRYLVLPGMTGLWQVSGRSELDFDELVR